MTKTAWTDNNYEGKALRRVLAKLIKRFEKLDKQENTDEEKLMKLAHTISMIANSKGALAKEETGILRKIKELEARLPPKLKPGTILDGVQESYKHMPKFSNGCVQMGGLETANRKSHFHCTENNCQSYSAYIRVQKKWVKAGEYNSKCKTFTPDADVKTYDDMKRDELLESIKDAPDELKRYWGLVGSIYTGNQIPGTLRYEKGEK